MSLKSRLDEGLAEHYVQDWNPNRLSVGSIAFGTEFTGFVIGDTGHFVPVCNVRVSIGVKRSNDPDDVEDRLRAVLDVINGIDDAYPQQVAASVVNGGTDMVQIRAVVTVRGV